MKFKQFFENQVKQTPITDLWPLNKFFYDMSTAEGKKAYDDDLKAYFDNKNRRDSRKIISEKLISSPYQITCWRGSDAKSLKRDTVDVGPGYRVMHGTKAMEGILWFAHSLQQDNPYEFARAYARGVFITYPLEAIKHVLVKTYDNGEVENIMPPELASKVDQSNASPYFSAGNAIYEVPDGWFFTWQVQKHLGCKKPIKILDSMISIESM